MAGPKRISKAAAVAKADAIEAKYPDSKFPSKAGRKGKALPKPPARR